MSVLTGKRVCISGKLSKPRSEIEALITEAGGVIASGVSKTTDYLVCGEDAGSKRSKAIELSIELIDEGELGTLLSGEELNGPLKGEARKLVQEQVLRGCLGKNGSGWFSDHNAVVGHYVLTGSFSETCRTILGEFPDYLTDEDTGGVVVTSEQYIEAAEEVIAAQAQEWLKKGLPQAIADAHYALLQRHYGETFEQLAAAHVKQHPDNKDAVWDGIWIVIKDEYAEPEVLLSGVLFETFKDKVRAEAKRFDDLYKEDEPDGVDYAGFPAEVELLFNQEGFGKPEQLTPEYVESIKARQKQEEAAALQAQKEQEELEAKYAKCQPSYSKPPTLDEYLKALSTVDDLLVPDTTGVRGFVELVLPGDENKQQRSQFYAYLISLMDREKSKVRRLLLEATTGEAVYSPLIQVFNNRKWAAYEPSAVPEPKPEPTAEALPDVYLPDEVILVNGTLTKANPDAAKAAVEKAGAAWADFPNEMVTIIVNAGAPTFDEDAVGDLAVQEIDEETFWLTLEAVADEADSTPAEAMPAPMQDKIAEIAAKAKAAMPEQDVNSTYFKIEHVDIPHLNEIVIWDKSDAASLFEQYKADRSEDETEIKMIEVPVNTSSNVTIYYWDNEMARYTDEGALQNFVVNTKEDALLFANSRSSDWGGHCSVLRLATLNEGSTTFWLPSEKEGYDFGLAPDWNDLLEYERTEEPFVALVGSEDAAQEMDVEEFKELIRTGKYP